MYAKIKANTALVWPYGYDDFVKDNKNIRPTGNIDLKQLFLNTEECVSNGCSLVEVTKRMPFLDANNRKFITASETPIIFEGEWFLIVNEPVPPINIIAK
jgi:hypothetical protein